MRGSEFADQEAPMARVLTLFRGNIKRKLEKYQLINVKSLSSISSLISCKEN